MVDQFKERLIAMCQRISAWAEMVEVYGVDHPSYLAMVMLTYRPEVEWSAGHIGDYTRSLNDRFKGDMLSYAWVSELSREGRVHYHLVALLRDGFKLPMPDKSGMWGHGWSAVRRARTSYYLLKYAGKEYQKDLSKYPKGCKLYGVSVRGLPEAHQMLYRNRSGLVWVKDGPEGSWEAAWVKGIAATTWQFGGSAINEGYLTNVLVPLVESRVQ